MRTILIKKFLLLIVLFLTVQSSGCDWLYWTIDRSGAEEKQLIGVVDPFEPNPKIAKIQAILQIYGFYSGRVDGMLGARTREAVGKFQKVAGIKMTRFVDKNTWAKLTEFELTGFIVHNQLNVKLVQRILFRLGLFTGKTDGQMGQRTIQAVKIFQKAHGLNPDGRIGYRTLQELSKYMQAPQGQVFNYDQKLVLGRV